MQIKPEHLEQLELEVQHIFDSGANEVRVYNMIQAFIEKRGKALFIPIVVDSEVELVCDTCDKPAEFVEKKCCECAYADLQQVKTNYLERITAMRCCR